MSTKEERREWEREWKEDNDRRKEDEYYSGRGSYVEEGIYAQLNTTAPQNPPPVPTEEQRQQFLVDAAISEKKERERLSCIYVAIALVVIFIVLPIVWAIIQGAIAFIFFKP